MNPAGVALLLALVQPAQASADPEEAALRLADDTTPKTPSPLSRPWQLSAEPALLLARPRFGGPDSSLRLSLEWSWRPLLAPDWRLHLADRLDLQGPAPLQGERKTVNTWKEGYLSHTVNPETSLDLGRINAPQGVAQGHNPTDFLRNNAVRSPTSVDPSSLRENRLGTVMLRAQRLWQGGSFSGWLAPRLADAPNPAPLSADLGATNARTRWLLAYSQAWGHDFAPQWLLHGEGENRRPRLGLNLTRLLGPACVAHLEAAGARTPTLIARAEGHLDGDLAFRTQLATGITCATQANLTLSAEYLRNGEALNARGWNDLRSGSPATYLAYRQGAQQRQDPPTRHSLFTLARWQNAWAPQWDLNGFLRWNPSDHSHQLWLEVRHRGDGTDWAWQWQHNAGDPLSEHGVLPQRELMQLVVKHYF